MKAPKNKKISFALILVAITTGLFLGANIANACFQASKAIPIIIFSLFYLVDIFLCIFFAIRMDKIEIVKFAKAIGIYQLCIAFFYWLYFLLYSLVSISSNAIIYFLILGTLIASLGARLFLTLIINHEENESTPGYSILKRANYITALYIGIILLRFILDIPRLFIVVNAGGLDVTDIERIPVGYFITIIIQIALAIIIHVLTLYLALTILISSFEKKELSFKNNFSYTVKTFRKYHMRLWLSSIGNLIMLIISIISIFTFGIHYAGLAMMFFIILLIKITTFFWQRGITKKYKNDHQKIYQNKHWIIFYASLIFIGYAVFLFLTRNFILFNANGKQTHSLVVIFAIYVPLAIFKTVQGIFLAKKANKSKDPVLSVEALLDVQIAIYTVNNAIYLLGVSLENPVLTILGIVMSFFVVFYIIGIGIYFFIVSILGLKNKRDEQYEVYLKYINSKNLNETKVEKVVDEL